MFPIMENLNTRQIDIKEKQCQETISLLYLTTFLVTNHLSLIGSTQFKQN